MMVASRETLLAECRRAKFVRYAHLNTQQLKDLLERGYHEITPKRKWWFLKIHSSRGLKPEDFDCNVYRVFVDHYVDGHMDGYLIRGIDLEGMFDSQFIPDRHTPANMSRTRENIRQRRIGQPVKRRLFETITPTITRLAADDDDEAQTNQTVYGGWYIPSSRFGEFTEFRNSLNRDIPPRSLQELAANVILSRELPSHLNVRFRNGIKQFEAKILFT